MSDSEEPINKRASLKDIARRANVSIGSVSSVINNRHVERRIPAKTAEIIRKAAAEVGYLPNISARRLRSRTAPKNALHLALITSFEAPIPLIDHFLTALRDTSDSNELPREDYSCSLMIEMFSAGHLRDLPALLDDNHFNAAILLNTVNEDDQFLKRSHLPYPVVLINRSIPGYHAVVEKPCCGTRPAEVFAKMKRRHLAVIHGSPLTQSTENRVNVFMRRTSELIRVEATEIVAQKLSEMSAYESMKATLASGIPIDALYAVSDSLALGAYRAIKEAGLSIPEDIAVIGVGDYPISPFMDPPLSCIGVSHGQMARLSSNQLVSHLLRRTSNPEIIEADTVERLRASTGH